MDISFIRHGQSIYDNNTSIRGEEVLGWIKGYDENGVKEGDAYPSETLSVVREAGLVITSDLPRAMSSAALLHPEGVFSSFSLFREAELPVPTGRLLKLKPSTWAVMLRLMWFMGYSSNCESYKEAKIRAKEAADTLIQYAKNSGSVVLVGHGFFNSFIAKELQRRGWAGKQQTSSKHWSCTTYSHPLTLNTDKQKHKDVKKGRREVNFNG